MKKIIPIRIDDYLGIKKSLREFMRETKTHPTRDERIARLRFIKSIKMEVDTFLLSRKLMITDSVKRRKIG